MSKPATRVNSLDELLARCAVAKEQRLSETACIQSEQLVTSLGLPCPGDATNADLKGLLPLYAELLKDLSENVGTSPFLRVLRDSSRESPDAAIALLYFIEFPGMVRTVRASVSDISECNVNEPFNCIDLVDEIAKNSSVINWCRGALSSSGDHHSNVLASCISILDSINRIPRQKAKKYIKKNVLCVRKNGSRDEMIEGFRLLRSDLADVVSRDDVKRDAAVNAILFQMHSLATLFGEDAAIDMMKNSPRKKDFERGLSRHRRSFNENEYQLFRALLNSENQTFEEVVAGTRATRSRKPLGEHFECARKGCSNEGTRRCNRCRIVSYCSRDCQLVDWKTGHKKVCKSAVGPTRASEEAVQAARSMVGPALRSQDDFLRANPHVDYRIVLPTGSQDVGVVFTHPMGKSMFKMWRSKAPEPPSINRMYEMLLGNQPDKSNLIRKQLRAEYGVDVLGSEAKQTAESMPTPQQILNSMSPNMIFYPENRLSPGEIPTGSISRGTIGHEAMFMATMSILEERVQKMWTQSVDSGLPPFEEHTPVLLALLDAGIAQNHNETHRAKSTTLCGNEKRLKLQLFDLERRLRKCDESFLFIPLEHLYYNLPHIMIKSMLASFLGNQADFVGKVMGGYTSSVLIWTHRQGPHPAGGSRPMDEDLAGPHPFKYGIRLHCGMSSTIAIMLIFMLMKGARVSSASEVFVFPHSLVFALSSGDQSFHQVIKGMTTMASIHNNAFESWCKQWCLSGEKCTTPRVDGVAVEHVGFDLFMEKVRKTGCAWYPLFSEDLRSSILYK